MIYEKIERKLVIPFSKNEWITVSPLNSEEGIAVMLVHNNNGNYQSRLLGLFKHKEGNQVALTFLSILYPVHAIIENLNTCSVPEKLEEGDNTIKIKVKDGVFIASFTDTPENQLTIYFETNGSAIPFVKYIITNDNGIKSIMQNPLGSVYCNQPCREIDLLNSKF